MSLHSFPQVLAPSLPHSVLLVLIGFCLFEILSVGYIHSLYSFLIGN